MSSMEMKEIRIPSALVYQRPPSVVYTLAKAFAAAFALAAISFFVLNACAIAALAIAGAVRHRLLDFSMAYRYFAAPSALGIFVIALVGALIFFFRERSR